jgi:hypothetical protein
MFSSSFYYRYIEGPISSRHNKQIEYITNYMSFAADQPRKQSQKCASLLQAHAAGLCNQREA